MRQTDMAGSYTFAIDERRNLVRMTLHGFFSPDEIVTFDRDRRLAYRQLQCAPNRHLTLIDIRGTQIQSQDAVAAFTKSIADPATKGRRVAFVISRTLARLQIRRAAEGRDAGYFLTIEEAEAWLLNDHAAGT